MSSRPVVRWVTWWPSPYWVDRFNVLAKSDYLDLEVVFLSAGVQIQAWELDVSDWEFSYKILAKGKTDKSGYFGIHIDSPFAASITTGRYDAIILHYASVKCLSAALVSVASRRHVYFFVPNTPLDLRKTGLVKEFIKGFVLKRATGLLATGPFQVSYARSYQSTVSKISEIGNPTRDLSHSWRVRGELPARVQSEAVTLLYVGRLSQEKELDTLFHSIRACRDNGVDLELLVIGDGPLRASLESLAGQLDILVRFVGFVQQDDLGEYFISSDIFVLPSLSEPWGLVVNEAMYFELPIILSDRIGCSPVLLKEQVNGFSFAAGDVDQLSNCITTLARDRDLRLEMGRASKRLIDEHSIDAWVAKVERVFCV